MSISHLIAKAIALTTITLVSALPTTSKSPNFRITANFASDSPLSAVAAGWNLTSYHISPCYDYAVFTNETGRTFYANGTSGQFASHSSNLLSDGGTPPWPWGTIVAAANATDDEGRRNVYIDCGTGTPGFEVADWPGTVYYRTGTFYVCNSTFLYSPAIALYWREKVDNTPAGGGMWSCRLGVWTMRRSMSFRGTRLAIYRMTTLSQEHYDWSCHGEIGTRMAMSCSIRKC